MKIVNNWLILAVTALGLSGLFTIFLIIGRTSNLLPPELFPPALIVHVNLDVLVWLLAMITCYFNYQKERHYRTPFFIAAAGTGLLALSPFIGSGEAYTNNYIPVFDNAFFKFGLGLFLAAIAFETITTFLSRCDFKTRTVAALLIMGFAAFIASYISITDKTSSHYLYEYLFWGGGHILQFAYVQIMLCAWLILAEAANIKLPVSPRLLNFVFLLPVIFVFVSTIFIYSTAAVETSEHIQMFTQQMIYGAALAAIPLSFLLFIAIIINLSFTLYPITLLFSIILFTIGGGLGNSAAQAVANGEITTIIPAHYHFSTVAVTVALMGYIYSRLKFKNTKLALWQIILYSIGQIFYFTGMAIFGGHGAPRKTPGVDTIQMDESTRKLVEHVMHGGGLLSLIGGILFVLIVLKALRKPHQAANNN